MSSRIDDLRRRYELAGDTEALTNLEKSERRHVMIRIGHAAHALAIVVAAAIAWADLVRFRIVEDGFQWDVGHLARVPHHWLWIPLALLLVTSALYRRSLSDD